MQKAKEADVAYDPDDPASTYWGGLGELILGAHRPWRRRRVRTSVFTVRHTHAATDLMEQSHGGHLGLHASFRAAVRLRQRA